MYQSKILYNSPIIFNFEIPGTFIDLSGFPVSARGYSPTVYPLWFPANPEVGEVPTSPPAPPAPPAYTRPQEASFPLFGFLSIPGLFLERGKAKKVRKKAVRVSLFLCSLHRSMILGVHFASSSTLSQLPTFRPEAGMQGWKVILSILAPYQE